MTHQLDLMPTHLVDASVLDRIDAQLPKTREVKSPRLHVVLPVADSTVDEMFHVECDNSIEVSQ